MIIISQDKSEIINFNNILSVKLYHDNEDAECLYEIYTTVNAPGDNYILLGIYNIEERAKEVLQEITNTFSAGQLNGTLDEMDLILKAKAMARYEMPKE